MEEQAKIFREAGIEGEVFFLKRDPTVSEYRFDLFISREDIFDFPPDHGVSDGRSGPLWQGDLPPEGVTPSLEKHRCLEAGLAGELVWLVVEDPLDDEFSIRGGGFEFHGVEGVESAGDGRPVHCALAGGKGGYVFRGGAVGEFRDESTVDPVDAADDDFESAFLFRGGWDGEFETMFHVIDPEAGIGTFVFSLLFAIAPSQADTRAAGGIPVAFAGFAHFGKEAWPSFLRSKLSFPSVPHAIQSRVPSVVRSTR